MEHPKRLQQVESFPALYFFVRIQGTSQPHHFLGSTCLFLYLYRPLFFFSLKFTKRLSNLFDRGRTEPNRTCTDRGRSFLDQIEICATLTGTLQYIYPTSNHAHVTFLGLAFDFALFRAYTALISAVQFYGAHHSLVKTTCIGDSAPSCARGLFIPLQ